MNFDVSRVSQTVNAFWSEHGYAVIAASGVLLLALVIISVVKVVRSRQRDRWVGGVTALVVLAWTSEGLWEVAYFTLELPLGFAVMTFFVYEAMMLTSAMQAERHRKTHPSPGPAGRYVWVLATITASIVALNASTLVEALLRFTLPLAAAGLWWVGITAAREDDPAGVQDLREEERQRREAIWAINLRRILVAAGVMRPGTQTLNEAERERRIRQMVIAADRLHAAKPDSGRARRALRRLRGLARLASANDIAIVRARVARATRIAELVLPTDARSDVDGAATAVGAGVRSNGRSVEAGAGVPRNPLGVSAPYHPNGRSRVSRDGDAPPGPNRFYETPPPPPDARASVPRNGNARPERSPATVAAGGGRATAERLYRESVDAGTPLTTRQLAARSGCSTTTAWRGIKSFQAASADS